jgi:hypothetical protein
VGNRRFGGRVHCRWCAASEVTSWVYRVAASLLVALAVVTALTGARTKVIWFKICPVLLSSSAVLLLVASLV